MKINNDIIKVGDICWRLFPVNKHNTLGGDYCYAKECYAKNASKKIEDGNTYLKIKITKIFWFYGNVRFCFVYVNKDNTLSDYNATIDGAKYLSIA